MNNFRVNKKFYLVLLCVLFLGTQFVGAAGTFQNNLLKVNVYKNSAGGVKILLVTNKPYGDSVVVNKKSDYEYVILLPETSNSITTKPALKLVPGVVKNIDVKMQQYQNQVKGYTKLVISTSKPIEITPQVQTINTSSYKSSEKYYNSLLAQANKKSVVVKKASSTIKVPVKSANSAQVKRDIVKENINQRNKSYSSNKTISASKVAVASKVVQKAPRTLSKKPVAPKIIPKAVSSVKQIQPKLAVAPKEPAKKVLTQSPVQKSVQTPEAVPSAQPAKNSYSPAQPSIKKEDIQNAGSSRKPDVVAPPIKENIVPAVKPETKVAQNPADKFVNGIQKIKNIVKNNIYTVAGLALAPLVLILLFLVFGRKKNKNIKQQDSSFAESLEEAAPLAEENDNAENIDEGEGWQDRFQSYVDESHLETTEDISQDIVMQNNSEIDEMFDEEEIVAPEFSEETPEQTEEVSGFDEGIISEYDDIGNDDVSIDALLDAEEISEEDSEYDLEIEDEAEDILSELEFSSTSQETAEGVVTPVEDEKDEMIQSEFEIDDKKGFYLVDFEGITALVGHIEEEIFVLKRFEEKINAPLQARINESKGNAVSYMAKVGKFKGIVEVTPDNMNLLIEL